MKAVILDSATLGEDVSFESFCELADEVEVYKTTSHDEIKQRIADADIAIVNKIKLNESNLENSRIKLICVAATGFDNIDTAYCTKAGISVCNVPGYSADSVAQLTLAIVLELVMHMRQYTDFVRSGEYTQGGIANKLSPTFHELNGMVWGIVGYGAIGQKVARIARAFGCEVLVNKKTPVENVECVGLDELCKRSDVITLHTPLTAETRGMIGERELALMKKGVILVNVARGAVTDEEAVARAVEERRIGAFGSDVYSVEPFGEGHAMDRIKMYDNVCLTPHMAWGAYEARVRCLNIIAENIRCFIAGKPQNCVNL